MTDFVFPAGRILDNFETLGAVATKTWTVPTGSKWLIYGGCAERDQNTTFKVEVTTSADKLIMRLHEQAAGITLAVWPVTTTYPPGPFPAKAGDKIVYTWGAAQTTPEISLLVLEIDIP